MVPQTLHRIEFGGVGRQPFDTQARVVNQHFANRWPFVEGTIIPDHDDPTAQVAEEIAEKAGRSGAIDVLIGIGMKIETELARNGGKRKPGNYRNFLTFAPGDVAPDF
jgi:hypothetical protein